MKTHRLVLIQDPDYNPLYDQDETIIYLPNYPYYGGPSYSGTDLDSWHKTAVERVLDFHGRDTRVEALTKHFQRNGFDTDFIEADYYNLDQDILVVRQRDDDEDPDQHWTSKTEIQAWINGDIYTVAAQRKVTYYVTKTPLDPLGPTTTDYETTWVEDDAIGGCILTEDYTAYDVAKYYFEPVYSNPEETETEYVHY